jgi:hypothetical protein
VIGPSRAKPKEDRSQNPPGQEKAQRGNGWPSAPEINRDFDAWVLASLSIVD